MTYDLSKLSLNAASLIAKKKELSRDNYHMMMEDLVSNIAEFSFKREEGRSSHDVDFIKKMSFEIRTPMNSILGFTGLLKDSYFSKEEKKEFIKLIEKNTQHLVELLNDLNDLTKVENHQMDIRIEDFEFNVMVLSIFSKFKERAEEQMVILDKVSGNGASEDICISTDPYQLSHIISNIIQYLLEYTTNGRISVDSKVVDGKYLIINIISGYSQLLEANTNSIQTQISRVKNSDNFDGTGLRLSLTKALVDILNGEIEFHSKLGKGSGFEIKIPVGICGKK